MHIYTNHEGGPLWSSNKLYSTSELHCDVCGDYDDYIGEYDSWEDFIKQIDKEMFEYYLFNADYLAESAEIPVEEVYKLKPEIKGWEDEYYGG